MPPPLPILPTSLPLSRGGNPRFHWFVSEVSYPSSGGTPCGGIHPASGRHGGSPPMSLSQRVGLPGRTPQRSSWRLCIPPSLLRILDIHAHFFLAFRRLTTTTVLLLFAAVMRWPSYLNDATLVSGRPYAWNAVSVPARASSAASLRHFINFLCVSAFHNHIPH